MSMQKVEDQAWEQETEGHWTNPLSIPEIGVAAAVTLCVWGARPAFLRPFIPSAADLGTAHNRTGSSLPASWQVSTEKCHELRCGSYTLPPDPGVTPRKNRLHTHGLMTPDQF